jgi:hypothetical protein
MRIMAEVHIQRTKQQRQVGAKCLDSSSRDPIPYYELLRNEKYTIVLP